VRVLCVLANKEIVQKAPKQRHPKPSCQLSPRENPIKGILRGEVYFLILKRNPPLMKVYMPTSIYDMISHLLGM